MDGVLAYTHLMGVSQGRMKDVMGSDLAGNGSLSAEQRRVPELIPEHRAASKLRSTCTQRLPEWIHPEDGRRLRRSFVAKDGCVMVSPDYSQVELRLMAHMSGDPGLVGAFAQARTSTARRRRRCSGWLRARSTPTSGATRSRSTSA